MYLLSRASFEEEQKYLLLSNSLQISREFLQCLDEQLANIFFEKTGLNKGKNIAFIFPFDYYHDNVYSLYYIDGTNMLARELKINLVINHNWNNLHIRWKSKSNLREYRIHETDIDPTDIVFWFKEELDPILYKNQLYPNPKVNFKLKNLSFELIINRLNIEMEYNLTLKKLNDKSKLEKEIYQFIEDYNVKSEKKDRKDGVIHNTNITTEGNRLICAIDTGFTGEKFMKKFLLFLSSTELLEKVVVN